MVQRDNFLDIQEFRVLAGVVLESLLDRSTHFIQTVLTEVDFFKKLDRRPDYIVVFELEREVGIVRGAHYLVQLFTRAYSDDFQREAGRHCAGQINDSYRRNLGHEDFSTLHPLEVLQHEVDALLQRYPESTHPLVSNREWIAFRCDEPSEQRHDRSTGTDYVTIANDRKPRSVTARDVVRGNEQLVGSELRCAIEVDRVRGLVGRKRNDLVDAGCQRRMEHILRAVYVRLDALHRVIFGRGHLLQSGRVYDVVNLSHRLDQAIPVAHVSNEVTHAVLMKLVLHLRLFQLIPRINDDFRRSIALEYRPDVLPPELTRAACDENPLSFGHVRHPARLFCAATK